AVLLQIRSVYRWIQHSHARRRTIRSKRRRIDCRCNGERDDGSQIRERVLKCGSRNCRARTAERRDEWQIADQLQSHLIRYAFPENAVTRTQHQLRKNAVCQSDSRREVLIVRVIQESPIDLRQSSDWVFGPRRLNESCAGEATCRRRLIETEIV